MIKDPRTLTTPKIPRYATTKERIQQNGGKYYTW